MFKVRGGGIKPKFLFHTITLGTFLYIAVKSYQHNPYTMTKFSHYLLNGSFIMKLWDFLMTYSKQHSIRFRGGTSSVFSGSLVTMKTMIVQQI